MKSKLLIFIFSTLFLVSCFKEIDKYPLERKVESTFTVQKSIKNTQSYHYFYESIVLEVASASPNSWDLAFESKTKGNKVLLGWANGAVAHKTGKFNIAEVTQQQVLDYVNNPNDWTFDDPAYTNFPDSLSLQNWENGEVYVINRASTENKYYLIQFVSKTEESYTFKYAKATDNQTIKTQTITRSAGINFIHFSLEQNKTVEVEPLSNQWDIMFTPYLGWWETNTPGIYSPYNFSGVLINNEAGVRVAQIFDENIDFQSIDQTFIASANFTDWKGAIGSNWKRLGPTGSADLYIMDTNKKYLLKKYDVQSAKYKYFKLRFVSYKLNGLDHYPTIEFKFLADE